MSTSVLIVERPGEFRDGLLREVNQRGAEVAVRDDAIDALAALEQLDPDVVIVSDDPGPPGAQSLCRLLQRKLKRASVFRLGEPNLAANVDERTLLLPRAASAASIAQALLDRERRPTQSAWASHRAWNAPLGSLELGPLLLAIHTRWLTGRLLLTRPGIEREIVFVRGLPTYARSSVLSERLGPLGLRRGVWNEARLEQALDLAHARGLRLGQALLELEAVQSLELLSLLSAQLVEQLTAACNAGASHARFVLGQGAGSHTPLLRLHPVTALLHAVKQAPTDDNQRVLDELADREIQVDPAAGIVAVQWLADLQIPDAAGLTARASHVRTLRNALREALAPSEELPAGSSDSVALALLRAGAFRMGGRTGMVPTDLRAGMRTLSPPSVAAAIVRCAHSTFDDWSLTALARPHSPLQRAIDEYLRGSRPPEIARGLCLVGPQADIHPQAAEVCGLWLRGCEARSVMFDTEPTRSASEARERCQRLLARLDALEPAATQPLAQMQLLQLRSRLEQALGTLALTDAPHGAAMTQAATAPSAATDAPGTPTTGSSQHPATQRQAPANDELHDAELMAAVEPLVQKGNWHELRGLLAAHAGGSELPPGLALLYAIALKEDERTSPTDDDAQPAAHAEQLAIRAVGELLGTGESSAAAVVIAKRTLRRRKPLDWNQRPPARLSLLLIIAALLTGAFVGLLFHPSLLRFFFK